MTCHAAGLHFIPEHSASSAAQGEADFQLMARCVVTANELHWSNLFDVYKRDGRFKFHAIFNQNSPS